MNLSFSDKSQLVKLFTSHPNLPSLDPEYHRGWFVRQAVYGKITHYTASKAELEHILQQLLAYFYSTAPDKAQYLKERKQILEVIWPWFKPRLRHNKGLVKFMEQYGVYSRYFVPLLMYVPGALALCPAHGEALDIFGKPQRIPMSDALFQFICKDEMYAFARLRAEDAKPALEKAQRALVLGAGTLQEARQLQRFPMERLNQHEMPWLVAYDMDVRLRQYFDDILTESLEDYGIDYRYEDFRAAFTDAGNYEAYSLVGAWGVASYYDARLEWLLSNMARMLTADGAIKFDMQVLDGGSKLRKRFWQNTLVFDKIIMRWESDMQPRSSLQDAYAWVETVCAKVGLKIDYCKFDPEHPIGIIFQCSKL